MVSEVQRVGSSVIGGAFGGSIFGLKRRFWAGALLCHFVHFCANLSTFGAFSRVFGARLCARGLAGLARRDHP